MNIVMAGRYCLLLLLGVTLTVQAAVKQVEVASATARTFFNNNQGPQNAIDGNTGTNYVSSQRQPQPYQWLKLSLKEPTSVHHVVIINR